MFNNVAQFLIEMLKALQFVAQMTLPNAFKGGIRVQILPLLL